jgi:hypothetical protein
VDIDIEGSTSFETVASSQPAPQKQPTRSEAPQSGAADKPRQSVLTLEEILQKLKSESEAFAANKLNDDSGLE